jgi:hypothetical protein
MRKQIRRLEIFRIFMPACCLEWEIHRIWIVRRIDALPVEQEPHTLWRLALTLAESIHQLLQSSGTLDLEENLVIGIRDFDVEMFGLVVSLCAAVW